MDYIELKNISYSYPLTLEASIKDINLTIGAGEFVGIVGDNGSGKTTLCNIIRGFCPRFYKGELEGEVLIQGETLEQIEENQALAEKIGYIFQNPFTQLSGIEETVYNEIAFGLENIGLPRDRIIAQVDNIIAELDIQDFKNRNPFSLSGGQQQKVAIASILAMEPDIIIADEPTSQLDPETSEEVFSILNNFKEKGKTILLVEHNIDLLYKYADRILVVIDGQIVLNGRATEVFSNPKLEEYGVAKPNSLKLGLRLKEKFNLEALPCSEDEILSILKSKDLRNNNFDCNQALGEVKNAFVEVNNISYTYPKNKKDSIKNISLSFDKGKTYGIIGQNGAGKTTLVKAICGLLKPSKGYIKLNNNDIAKLPASKRSEYVGYVFQNPDDQIFLSTVRSEILYTNKKEEVDEELFLDIIKLCGLENELDNHPYNLSWSTRKFVAIATLLYLDPQVVIFDEPTAGQDIFGNRRLKSIIEKLKERGKIIIIITHDMEFITDGIDEIIVMNRGEILKQGRPEVILTSPNFLEKASLKQPYVPSVLNKLGGKGKGIIRIEELIDSLK